MMQSKSAKEVLLAAANLLEEKGWTQKAYARDQFGNSVSTHNHDAVCYCAAGSIRCVVSNDSYFVATSTLNRYLRVGNKHNSGLADWNDSSNRTKEEVIQTMRDCAATLY